MLTIKILGSGCANCKRLEQIAQSEKLVCAGRVPKKEEIIYRRKG